MSTSDPHAQRVAGLHLRRNLKMARDAHAYVRGSTQFGASGREWRVHLDGAATSSLEAPTWLWSSVVDLIGIHERAYLEHCRRYALSQEKANEEPLR